MHTLKKGIANVHIQSPVPLVAEHRKVMANLARLAEDFQKARSELCRRPERSAIMLPYQETMWRSGVKRRRTPQNHATHQIFRTLLFSWIWYGTVCVGKTSIRSLCPLLGSCDPDAVLCEEEEIAKARSTQPWRRATLYRSDARIFPIGSITFTAAEPATDRHGRTLPGFRLLGSNVCRCPPRRKCARTRLTEPEAAV